MLDVSIVVFGLRGRDLGICVWNFFCVIVRCDIFVKMREELRKMWLMV